MTSRIARTTAHGTSTVAGTGTPGHCHGSVSIQYATADRPVTDRHRSQATGTRVSSRPCAVRSAIGGPPVRRPVTDRAVRTARPPTQYTPHGGRITLADRAGEVVRHDAIGR